MDNQDRDKALLFTDGASKGNPGRGGWGCMLVTSRGEVTEAGGDQEQATNNQMELLAAIMGLEMVEDASVPIVVHTDSTYVIKGIQSWVKNWRVNSWQTKSGKPVANKDLWIRLWDVTQRLKVEWQHVKGHAGIPGNERADTIASSLALGDPCELFSGPLSKYSINPYQLQGVQKTTKTSGTPAGSSPSSSRKRALVYLSYIDGSLLEHRTWPECEARVKGRAGAKFKKAFCPADIVEIKKSWGLV